MKEIIYSDHKTGSYASINPSLATVRFQFSVSFDQSLGSSEDIDWETILEKANRELRSLGFKLNRRMKDG